MGNKGHGQAENYLLTAIKILCSYYKQRFSEKEILAGLYAKNGLITPGTFYRAAERASFTSSLEKCQLNSLNRYKTPFIILLKDHQACVVKRLISRNQAEVTFTTNEQQTKIIELQSLSSTYIGAIILVEKIHENDDRAESMLKQKPAAWFWDTIFSLKNIYSNVIIVAVLSNLFSLVIPLFMMTVYDRIVPYKSTTTLWVLAIGVLVILLFDFIARMIRGYLVDLARSNASTTMNAKIFNHLVNISLKNRPKSTGVINSYFSEFERVRSFYVSLLLIAAVDIPFIILFLIVIWLIGGSIVLIPLIAIPISIFFSIILEYAVTQEIDKVITGTSSSNAILSESMVGLESIKSITAESTLQQRWENSINNKTKAENKSSQYSVLSANINVWLQQLTIVGLIIYGVYLINQNLLTLGGLIAVTIIGSRAMALSQITNLLNQYQRSKITLNNLNKLMESDSDRPIGRKFISRSNITGEFKVDKVTFYYPEQPHAAINDISLHIKPGEKLGIVGRIGSGKSTLLKTIVGFYNPTFGTVMIDDADNRHIDPSDLRRQIQYVSHDSTLFYGSVRDNLLLAAPHATDEEIIHAAKITGVDRFVNENPLGYDMPVGERGENLSGGQRHAVALCRALLVNPKILLLDEPTGFVDNQFERNLISSLPEYLKNKTLVLATHRVSMLALVDTLAVLEGGNIVTYGPTKQILEKLKWKKKTN